MLDAEMRDEADTDTIFDIMAIAAKRLRAVRYPLNVVAGV